MAAKTTHLLNDDPATADEFGTHNKIAALIRDEILHSAEGRSIALVGDWGSGKSTIIELLKGDLANGDANDTHLFIYDAWSHQGDSLRRAFLDDFIASMKGRIDDREVADATDQVWNRTETTETIKEPVLRRHAKVLLISLALIPLGMKMFELPAGPEPFGGLVQGRNLLAYVFLLAPVVAVVLFGLINWTSWTPVKNFLFGSSHKEPGFSVLSFFFEKVQGHFERKHIKTPVDSIRAFRDVFSQLLDSAHTRNKELRVVIIIDNIDRIPPDQARDFWSTMQTFFGDSGGLRRPQTKKYWLVAPFSVEALSFLFRDNAPASTSASDGKADARTKAKAYIDKTFGLAFYVPPPILTNWRRYLLKKLRESFPQHSESEWIAVRDVYDFARSGAALTPREMKLFVNSLVVLYRQRGDEISLPVMAIYVLQRDRIVGTTINDDLVSPRERRLIEDSDWRVPIAALHFGVTLDEATQLLLQEPMLSALREGSKEKLKALEGRPGFADVLSRVTSLELESSDAEEGGMLAQMAATIGALDGASKPELTRVWWSIRNMLKAMKGWKELRTNSGEGIAAVLEHTPGSEKETLSELLANSLSKALATAEDVMNVKARADNWFNAAMALANGIGAGSALKIGLPGSIRVKIVLLEQLAESDAPDKVKTLFALNATPDELGKGLATEIAEGRFPRIQVHLVSLLVEKLELSIQWPPVISACEERLRVADVGARETESLINMIISARTIGRFDKAFNALKDLSTQGYLSHLLHQHRKDQLARAKIIAAIMLANPGFERPSEVEQSSNGDSDFKELMRASAFDAGLIQTIAEAIKSTRAEAMLFESGAKNLGVARLVAAVLGELSRSPDGLNIDPKSVVEQRSFLESNADLNPIADFLTKLSKAGDVLTLLANQPFELSRAQFYAAALSTADQTEGSAFANYLTEGMLALDKAQWDKSLNAGSGVHFELLELAGEVRKRNDAFTLSLPARDGALEQIRKVGNGKPAPSDDARGRLAKLITLLPEAQRSSLMRDVIDEMAGQSDAGNLTRRIELLGEHLTLDEEADADRIVRRILSPAVGNPTERSAAWMATVILRRLEFFRQMPLETKNEFGWRLRAALQNRESLSPSVIESLINIAGLLEINLSLQDDATPTKEASL